MASRGFAQHLFDVEKRRSERDEVYFQTTLRSAGAEEMSAAVLNISRYGFMARTSGLVAQEAQVEISLPPVGKLQARVVWALGNRIGAEFAQAIDPVSYSLLLDTIPRAA